MRVLVRLVGRSYWCELRNLVLVHNALPSTLGGLDRFLRFENQLWMRNSEFKKGALWVSYVRSIPNPNLPLEDQIDIDRSFVNMVQTSLTIQRWDIESDLLVEQHPLCEIVGQVDGLLAAVKRDPRWKVI